MKIGMDVHKESVYVTAMEEDGTIREQYEMKNGYEEWREFRDKYMRFKPDIAMEMSTSGKHVARLLRDMGFPIHIAHPASLALIFNASRKNYKEDSYKLAKLFRLSESLEVRLPSREAESMRPPVRCRKPLGEDMAEQKNRVHAILSLYGDTYTCNRYVWREGVEGNRKGVFKI